MKNELPFKLVQCELCTRQIPIAVHAQAWHYDCPKKQAGARKLPRYVEVKA